MATAKRNGPTQAEKLAQFDQIKHDLNKHQLAVYDLVNGKFGWSVRIKLSEYGPNETGTLRIRLSPRFNPLFLIIGRTTGTDPAYMTEVLTEDEIEEGKRRNPLGVWERACYDAMRKLYAMKGDGNV